MRDAATVSARVCVFFLLADMSEEFNAEKPSKLFGIIDDVIVITGSEGAKTGVGIGDRCHRSTRGMFHEPPRDTVGDTI